MPAAMGFETLIAVGTESPRMTDFFNASTSAA